MTTLDMSVCLCVAFMLWQVLGVGVITIMIIMMMIIVIILVEGGCSLLRMGLFVHYIFLNQLFLALRKVIGLLMCILLLILLF